MGLHSNTFGSADSEFPVAQFHLWLRDQAQSGPSTLAFGRLTCPLYLGSAHPVLYVLDGL
jgi:hypothetical protein